MKRKAKRWINNLDNMTLDERAYILKEISHSYHELYYRIDINNFISSPIDKNNF